MKLSLVLTKENFLTKNFLSIKKVSFVGILHLFLEEFKKHFFFLFFNGSCLATGSKQLEDYKKSFHKRGLVQESLLAGKSLVCLYYLFWMTDFHQNYSILPAHAIWLRLLGPKRNSCKPIQPHELFCLFKDFSWKSEHSMKIQASLLSNSRNSWFIS